MDHIRLCAAGHHNAARRTGCPGVDICLGIADDSLLAGGAGGGMDSREFLSRHGKEAERVSIAQILLCGERQLLYVVNVLDVARKNTGLIHTLFIERNVVVAALHKFAQPL